MNRTIKNYNKIIKTFSPRLIRTTELNNIGIYSKDIAELINAGYIERVKQGC